MVETKDKSTKRLIWGYLLYVYLIFSWPLLEARAEIENIFVGFLVQMKTLEFAFEIKWPLHSNNWAIGKRTHDFEA